jgi:hypothetical protein
VVLVPSDAATGKELCDFAELVRRSRLKTEQMRKEW